MNIKEAKKQIRNTIEVYMSKDEYDNPLIEKTAQRPIIIMGAPGLGKTAIMAQLAEEMNISLVAYSMTHHTRQSVLGLPVIMDKEYGKVSEYTMSEIIAELYETDKRNSMKGGILFLDEINCVSETLMPTMLQFLQHKKLGQHTIPENWIIVAAGNPGEYNKSARDFDVVTWDRLKRIDIEPDYNAFKQYFVKKGGHGSITTYLDIKKDNFYRYETTVDGNRFITARSWDNLSDAIYAYETKSIEVDLELISQYLQYEEIANDFFNYYCLYRKYEADYEIDSILDGTYSKAIIKRACDAPFDERYSLIGLLLNSLTRKIKLCNEDEDYIRHLLENLKEVKAGTDINEVIRRQIEKRERMKRMGLLTNKMNKEYERVISFMSKHLNDPFALIKEEYDISKTVLKDSTDKIESYIVNCFSFVTDAFGKNEELTIFVTELTVNYYSAYYISRHNIEVYSEYAKMLSLEERNIELAKEAELMNTEFEF